MFVDRVVIYTRAGKGGNGLISLAHFKYHEFGGPDGGDGGEGGKVKLRVNPHVNSLFKIKMFPHIRAENGQDGMAKNMHGRNGKDVWIDVPIGTVIYDNETDEQVCDMTEVGQEFVLLEGGRGGFGNAHFKSSRNKTPRFAEIGDVGGEGDYRLELKTVADVGIIGFPSVGKSTFIASVSNAKPKIADYEFTTLSPHPGVVAMGEDSMLLCDIPGLIEGAADGKGLGHYFLRHIERCSVLIHLVDIQALDLAANYKTIRKELENYSKALTKKPEIVAISKSDLVDEEMTTEIVDTFKKETGLKNVFVISAATHSHVKELLGEAFSEVQKSRDERADSIALNAEDADGEYKVFRPHLDREDTFDVAWNEEAQYWNVTGERIEQIGRMTMWGNREAEARVYDVLERRGIMKILKKQGCKFGDRIHVGGGSLKFMDFED